MLEEGVGDHGHQTGLPLPQDRGPGGPSHLPLGLAESESPYSLCMLAYYVEHHMRAKRAVPQDLLALPRARVSDLTRSQSIP